MRSIAAAAIVTMMLAPSAGAATLSASFGNAGRFPARTVIVSIPSNHPVTAQTVHVRENGEPASGISVTPLSTAQRGDFGVILVLDTSQSMQGQPITQAVTAARTLAAERAGNQELGVIEFNGSSSVVLPLTSDATLIRSALAAHPTLRFGSRIFDATLQAIQELHDRGVAAGTVIVLSDGADVGSRATEQDVAAAAAADHVHVYSVGIKDRFFSSPTLTSLARATGGGFTASSAAGIRAVFSRIESELRERYVVRYRSLQRLGEHVQVKLWIDGIPGAWTASYRTPAPSPPAPVPSPAPDQSAPSFWTSSLALALVSFAGALLLVGGALVYLVPRTREDALRLRIREFVESDPPLLAEPPAGPRTSERTDEWLGRFAWWPRFKEEVDVASFEMSPVQLVWVTFLVTITAALALSVVTGTIATAAPLLLTSPVLLRSIVGHRAARQRRAFADQLPGHMEEIGSAMRAGHSVAAAITSVAKDAVEPTKRELERAVADERLGVPLDAALTPVARRMRCTDIEQLALVATLNQRTGGSMAEVLDLIANAARERLDLRRELRALTAQARMSRWIVSSLPPAILAILALISPSYVHPLFHTVAGFIVLSLATALVLTGSFVMRLLVPNEE